MLGEDKPVDIWNIDQTKIDETNSDNQFKYIETDGEQKTQSSIYDFNHKKRLIQFW